MARAAQLLSLYIYTGLCMYVCVLVLVLGSHFGPLHLAGCQTHVLLVVFANILWSMTCIVDVYTSWLMANGWQWQWWRCCWRSWWRCWRWWYNVVVVALVNCICASCCWQFNCGATLNFVALINIWFASVAVCIITTATVRVYAAYAARPLRTFTQSEIIYVHNNNSKMLIKYI